ncbi:hypothetical protein G7Z17_g6796 [Cylindrodendrum hubeiense]|uniref:Zn(2)-C6 fungal-type domain-containing protein n=1 Tax=Cylindrodendrum hubeiense TaxID=595255 RepID=A0A9P5LFZ2_9HYPO|nr:hypothetical protein G7Z17_g6796 [Cylindrodendrum hubeiense]
MPTPKPAQARKTRSSTPRARTGCSTCRIRHVKCDETRPSCVKCVKAGWKCDGYPSQSGAPANSSQSLVTTTATKPLNITTYSIPFRIPGSQKDRQIIHYFCVQGASDISGFLSSEFWSQTVLQDSYREPVVRQALVALSSLHLDYVTADSAGTEVAGPETLHQYGRALRALQKRLATPSNDASRVALICCVLFYCFESTVGNAEAAVRHLQNGLQVLASCQEMQGEKGLDGLGDLKSLSGILARLDLQASLFDDGRMPFLTLTSGNEREYGLTDLSGDQPLSSLQDAQMALDKLLNWLIRLLLNSASYKSEELQNIPPHFLEDKRCLFTELVRWSQKFNTWCTTNQTANEQNLCWVQMLLINYRIAQMMLESILPGNDEIFGASPNITAHEVLDLVENVLTLAKQKNTTAEAAKNPRRNFSSENGIIIPLFLLAIKCSDESVCERASQLLAVCNRREGLYDAESMVAVLQHLNAAKSERKLMFEQAGVENTANASLEHWTLDLIDDREGGMDGIGKSTSRTSTPY